MGQFTQPPEGYFREQTDAFGGSQKTIADAEPALTRSVAVQESSVGAPGFFSKKITLPYLLPNKVSEASRPGEIASERV